MSIVKTVPLYRYVAGMEIRTEVDGPELEAVVVPYDTWSDVGPYEELMRPGVFDTTLSRHADQVKLVLGHDDSKPAIATPVEWVKAPTHLGVVYRFGSHAEAVEAHRQAAEGLFGGLSVGFLPSRRPEDNEWSADRSRVARVQARLLHVGLVTTPAYQDARLLAVREMDRGPGPKPTPNLDEWRKRLEQIKSGVL